MPETTDAPNSNNSNGNKRVQLDLKWVVMLAGFIATVGGFLSSYWKQQLDTQRQIWKVEKQAELDQAVLHQHYETLATKLLAQIDLLEQNVDNESAWQTRSIEQLASAIPDAVYAHELQKHGPKAANETTPAQIQLPKKPKKVESLKTTEGPDELDLLLKKKQLLAR